MQSQLMNGNQLSHLAPNRIHVSLNQRVNSVAMLRRLCGLGFRLLSTSMRDRIPEPHFEGG